MNNQKRPNLSPSQETIDFLKRILGDGLSEHPKVSAMLRSRTSGFFDKTKYPTEEVQ